jgi:hypothetical protein
VSRGYYNQTAAEWRAAVDAVRAAGGDTITLSVSHLLLIFFGYEQHQQERANALAWIGDAEQAGEISASAALQIRHKLGDLDDDQYADRMRDATHGEAS